MRLACVQLQAYDLQNAEEGLSHALAMTERALASSPNLILLPECTYPAYFLAGYGSARLRPPHEVLESFARLARRGNCYLALGLVEPSGEGILHNSAVMLAPDGQVVARGHKHFLWHFDSRWFAPGSAPALADTPWGKIGMFVCADGRLPEVPRLLALQGARLQLDLTGWVSSGRDPARLSNPQAEYMLRVRALENRCWMAAANKVGMEAGRVVYCGLSQIISPDGQVVARAGSTGPQVILADIPLDEPVPPLWPDFDPRRDRQPRAYALLAAPGPEAPVTRPAPAPQVTRPGPVPGVPSVPSAPEADPARSAPHVVRLAALQLAGRESLDGLLRGLTYEGVTAAVTSVLPDAPAPGRVAQDGGELPVKVVAWRTGREVVARLEMPEATVTVDAALALEHRVYSTAAGTVGIMLDREGLLPEVARVLALAGAEWLAWPCSLPADMVEAVARTRAAENKVFVVAANAPHPALAGPLTPEAGMARGKGQGPGGGGPAEETEGGASLVVDPDGRILAQAFAGTEQSVAGQAHLCLARHKIIVPGTDAFAHRQPRLYAALAGAAAQTKAPPPGG